MALSARAEATASGEDAPLALRLLAMERRLQRERATRLNAEAIAERGMRDLYERQRQLELLAAIASSANASASPELALDQALQAICGHTGWRFGHALVLSPGGEPRMCSSGVAFAQDPQAARAFMDRSLGAEFRPGEGLPGRVWADAAPHWIDDAVRDPNFARAAEAEACGLHAAFAFPLMVGPDVRGVMEFFHATPLSRDDSLLELAGRIGTQLGRVLERAGSQRKLLFEAAHDALTGLPNRAAFADAVRRALARQGSACVLAVDLDGFKHVNDTLGHSAGDSLLEEVAHRLAALSGEAMVARLGGDEFAVLLGDDAPVETAQAFAAEVIAGLSEPVRLGAAEARVGVSVGVARAPDHAEGLDELLAAADLALYRAKADGRGCARVFAKEMRAAAVRRHVQEGELRKATLRGELELHYQPQVDARSGALVGVEALLRWRHPREGLLGPGAFLQTLESSALAREVGAWIVRRACADTAAWRARGAAHLRVAVNLFPVQLRDDLPAVVAGALQAADLAPDALEIEITENIALRHDDGALAPLKALRDLGVGVAFDDYGTGYASFSSLKRFPLTRLKIDRGFTAAMCQDSRDAAVVVSVLELARAFGLLVTAEGVETERQRAELVRIGCGELQGFLFDAAMEADRFAAKYLPPKAQPPRTRPGAA